MNNEEYLSLKKSIKENGLINPVVLYENKILDGRNRYNACQDVGIKPSYTTYKGDDPVNFVVIQNKERRQLTTGQLAFVAVEIEKVYAKLARENQSKGWGNHGITNNNPVLPILAKPNEEIEPIHATEKASEEIGVSTGYIKDAKKIQVQSPELAEKIKAGEMTIPEAKREIKRQEVILNLESIEVQEAKEIEGVYDVIVIDPPWPMQKIERDVAPEQVAFEYPVMTINEILQLEIPVANNSHVFLWTTQKYLPDAFELLDVWGLKYVCTFVWHKNGGFQPFGLPQYNCEFVLYARFGTPSFIDFKNFFTCFNANRTKHSEKPEEFYSTIRRVTAGRRLDMFNRRMIEGFDTWGKEAK